MLNRFKSEDEGFTLIELLVVILIIGILAAIALPSFLGQQKKGQNADAKSNIRNAVSQIESCYADTQDYQQCVAVAASATGNDLAASGLPLGTGAASTGTVGATSSAANGYVVTAGSRSNCVYVGTKTGGAALVKTASGTGCGGATSW